MADSSSNNNNDSSASTSAATTSSSEGISITVRAPGDKKVQITISPSKTVAELKQEIAGKTDVEADRQRLIYSGRILKDEELVEVYKIRPGDTVHLVKGASKAAPPPPAAQVPQSMGTGNNVAGNPLAPLLNATNPVGNFNPFADLGLNTNDPNMLQGMMNSPQAQEQIRAALSNPAVIDQIIDSSPELRAMGPAARQIMQSEQFRNMLSNPQAMAQMARQAEQMRNNPMFSQLMQGGGPGGFGGLAGLGGFGGLGAFGGGAAAAGTDPWGAPIGGGAAAGNTAGTQNAGQQNRGPTNLFNNAATGGGAGGAENPAGAAGNAAAAANPFGAMPDFNALQQLLGGFGGAGAGAGAGAGGMPPFGGFGSPPPQQQQQQDSRPPEERFANELQTLREMGFINSTVNVRALLASGGNVQAAVEYILSSQSW